MHNDEKIHFIGVGGASMSALAKFAKMQGMQVTGSDRTQSDITKSLEKLFPIFYGEHPEIVDHCHKVVYSSAISCDNLEMKRAKELGIPTVERCDFLGQIADGFQKTIAIAGAHGKTTATAMIAHGLKTLGKNFSAHIGGETEYGNLILEGGEFFVTEACEYKKSLLSLNPYVSLLLNVELDHPDCYKDMKSLLQVFLTFLSRAEIKVFPAKFIDICQDEHMLPYEYESTLIQLEQVKENGNLKENSFVVLSNGKVDIWSSNLDDDISKELKVLKNGKSAMSVMLPNNHKMTMLNGLAVVAVLSTIGCDVKEIENCLANFKGVKRRNEYIGRLGKAKVVFDYAHHPTQIAGIISAHKGKNLVVFQPHTYTRTKAYFDDFVGALSLADRLAILDTYGARENKIQGADSIDLVRAISTKCAQSNVEHIKSDDKTIEYVKMHKNDYDNILFLGAGDIYLMKDKLMGELDDVFGIEVQDVMKVF